MDASQDDVILELRDVTKAYSAFSPSRGQSQAQARRGECVGRRERRGKSTLMRIIAGVEQPTLGEIWMEGERISLSSPADAVKHGIGIVFQELNLFGNLTVAENIFATRERLPAACAASTTRRRWTRPTPSSTDLKPASQPKTLAEDLPIGQQQLVEIARAVSLDTRILIMDEPTSALSAAEVDILFRVIAELKAQGVAIVYISTGWKS